jgi:ribonuclease PH
VLEIYLTVMEDGGSMMAACITAAGIALIEIEAGIPVYDTLVGSTLIFF